MQPIIINLQANTQQVIQVSNKGLKMFIMINFGYKCKKIFTIDCLAAALFDCIWEACYKQLCLIYENKQQLFNKQIVNHQKKIEQDEKKLQAVLQKLKDQQENNPDKKKQDKKGAKKGGKDAPVASSPLQQQKIDLEASVQFSKTALTKYNEKLEKIKQLRENIKQWNNKVQKEQVYVQLVDKAGERKFVKTKLDQQANQFLSDHGIYYLCTVKPEGQEQEVEPIVHQGFPIRTVEQDAAITNEQPVFSIKKDDKGKKGGKKK